ncbi:efflux RND transporter periplasmic adaptor subunit [Colwellia sp. 6_MG-2023]|uniref:efflux RND transporter periplasmic adaptor subunit n=1 Tax=Colwellia sp. 6_MG-2023 TaxID=3062676 RepID=UPI0026E34973|nr:efflux RND transporter periplasmic adaptor subunit [Colwellia sp. 6_MG-2023]MDO6488298.1 efflux RND transporter periplasmic adaptor subunit [Colwellia sp. 6_MG-2023]
MTQINNPKSTQKSAQKSIIKKLLLPVIALFALLLMVAWLAGSFDEKISPSLNEDINQVSNIANFDKANTYTVIERSDAIFEPVAASVEAKQTTIISSRMLARINTIAVRAGDKVKKGDLLVELEQSDLQSQVLQTKQNIIALQARYKEAKQNFERSEELLAKQLISTFNFDKANADYQSIVAELTAAEQRLSQAETTLSYATLTAPINGLIVDRFAQPGDTAQAGAKLLSLYNPLLLRVEAQVREQLALTLTLEQKIDIELPSINKTITGEIEEIVPAANTGSRSFLIKTRIKHNEHLLPGMYARMLIPAGEQVSLTVPLDKISHVGQLDFVWLNVNGTVQRRFVRLGKIQANNMVTVISGLQSGDVVFTPLSK